MKSYAWTRWTPGAGHVPDREKARAELAGTVREGLVLRWRSNGRVPPADCFESWLDAGCVDAETVSASAAARDVELEAFLADYRRRDAVRVRSEEEAFELRAAFGLGALVVDVISGRSFRT